ncbi:MAG: hemerythrin family protein [Gammaproteobacteria bacterium]|uniref:Hemerythrin family protein n=1 Tax=Candidatus Thiopontia autotrophica TaxID=2841688 RepID=A0A8J6P7G1_9GAMM|nr:hemerythrin family protein [Candidatus Thiopontia autotrophica]MBL6969007.1 hemerythrin family protein [Gammaproteobacteria bacterium]
MKKSYSMFALFSLIIIALVVVFLGFVVFGPGNPVPWVILVILALIPYFHERSVRKEYIEWSSQYEVGVKLIDHDHQKLVGLLNQVVSASHYNMGKGYVKGVIEELIEYTKYHFEREEGLMRDNNWTDIDAHMKQHRDMVDKVEAFSSKYTGDLDGQEELSTEIHHFLKDWLLDHIVRTDKELGQFLISSGVK